MRASQIPRSTFSLATVFPVLLLLGLLAMTARPATDPDLWWHLRTGQWIIENLRIPHADPFSFTRAGQPWVAHEWLTDVIFFELWKCGGPAALIVFSAIVTTAGFVLLYFRCIRNQASVHWAAAATALGALAAAPCWGVRPQMFTFTFASLLLWLLERGLVAGGGEKGKPRTKLLLWIPPLFLLWVNVHAGFALGLALLFAYGLGVLIEAALGETPWPQARTTSTRLALLLAVCLALVPLNPSGLQLYRYPLDTLRSPAMRSFIVEWFSPDFHQRLYLPFLIAWILLLTALAFSPSRPRGRTILLLVFTSLAALDAVRHIPIFLLVAIPVLAAAFPGTSTVAFSSSRSTPSRFRRTLAQTFAATVVLLMTVFTTVRWASLASAQYANEQSHFPQKAFCFLKSDNRPHRLFAYYDWGGYAIWKLYPSSKVFVDGRADLYGDNLLHQFETVVNLRSGWRQILDTWDVDAVVVPPTAAVAQALLLDPQWRNSFHDSQAILLVRQRAPTEDIAAP